MASEGEFPKVDGDVLYASEVNAFAPVGVVHAWLKTFGLVDSGTTDGTTANKLVQSGQNFSTTVTVGDVVHNTTDTTFAYVTAIDSDTTLSIDSDIMVSGESFSIYKTTALPSGWVECNGQVISDSTSIYDGQTIPNLNSGSIEDTYSFFLRGHTSSGQTETSQNKAHTHTIDNGVHAGGGAVYGRGIATPDGNSTNSDGGDEARPMSYTVVWIMRIQ